MPPAEVLKSASSGWFPSRSSTVVASPSDEAKALRSDGTAGGDVRHLEPENVMVLLGRSVDATAYAVVVVVVVAAVVAVADTLDDRMTVVSGLVNPKDQVEHTVARPDAVGGEHAGPPAAVAGPVAAASAAA